MSCVRCIVSFYTLRNSHSQRRLLIFAGCADRKLPVAVRVNTQACFAAPNKIIFFILHVTALLAVLLIDQLSSAVNLIIRATQAVNKGILIGNNFGQW
jgi:hypothetical protein